MKNKIAFLLILFSSSILLNSCKKDHNVFNTYFWTSNKSAETFLLYIDGNSKGTLPKLSAKPDCGNAQALLIQLTDGKHTIEVKDANNNVRTCSKISLKQNSKSTTTCSGSTGGVGMTESESCEVIEIIIF